MGVDDEPGAPEPEEIYARTRREGARRLDRPLLELVSTALAAGFDIVAAAGNMVGGIGLVTLIRFRQARARHGSA